jgi:Protein of unknown function (DUF3107)
VEVKIGVLNSPREIVIDSSQTPDEVQNAYESALKTPDGTFSLTDEKGRRVIVAVSSVAYLDVSEADVRRVGFIAG